MIIAYFESNTHAEEAKRYDNEAAYIKDLPRLLKEAKSFNMKVTETEI